jgi:hypothetical protein
MTDKADYTGTIRAKGLKDTGITEAMLGRHHRSKSGRLMIVASVHVAGTSDNVDEGTGSVAYVIDDLEVAPQLAEEHLRELVRSFHYERKLEEEGPGLDDDGLTPKIGDAVAAGTHHEPHPFLPTDAADDTADCEVCGLGETAAAHRAYAAQLAQSDQDDAEPADDSSDQAQDGVEEGAEPVPV